MNDLLHDADYQILSDIKVEILNARLVDINLNKIPKK